MNSPLVPCESCGRHLRALATVCPFCAAAHTPVSVPEVAATGVRLSRTAMLAVSAGLAAAVMDGCNSTPAYGVPPGPYDAQVIDAGVTDAGAPTDGPPADDGGPAVRYGAPPPPTWC